MRIMDIMLNIVMIIVVNIVNSMVLLLMGCM